MTRVEEFNKKKIALLDDLARKALVYCANLPGFCSGSLGRHATARSKTRKEEDSLVVLFVLSSKKTRSDLNRAVDARIRG